MHISRRNIAAFVQVFKKASTAVFITLVLCLPAISQTIHTHPHGAAMGKTGTAYITGTQAPSVNPANLMQLDRPGSLYVDLLNVSVGTGGGLMNISVYNTYLTQDRLITAEVRQRMLDQWFPGGQNAMQYVGLQVEAQTLGLAMRPGAGNMAFSLSHSLRALVNAGVNRPVFEAGFAGLDTDVFGTPTRLQVRAETVLFHDITAGFAMTVLEDSHNLLFGLPGRLDAGIAPKLLISTYGVDFTSDSRLKVSGDSLVTHDFTYRLNASGNLANELLEYQRSREAGGERQSLTDFIDNPLGDVFSPAGTGFGLSMGLNLKLELPRDFLDFSFLGRGKRNIRAGLALTDIGSVPVSKDAAKIRHENRLEWRGTRIDNEWVDNEFEGNLDNYLEFALRDSLGSDTYLSYGSVQSDYTMRLPTQLSLGTQLEVGRASAALDFHKGFNNTGLNSRRLLVGMGLEYRIADIVPVRTGFSVGGKFGTRLSSGVGLHTSRFRMNTAFSAIPSSRNRGAWLGLSFNTTIRI